LICIKLSIPSTDDASLGLSNCDILADNDELDTVCFMGMERSILFLGQTKVEDVSGVVPKMTSGGSNLIR